MKKSYVPIGIFEISYLDELKLNKYEGYPKLYYKKYLKIKINDKIEKAMIYIMKSKFDYHIPSKEYIDICMKGYDDFGFDNQTLQDALQISKNKCKKLTK